MIIVRRTNLLAATAIFVGLVLGLAGCGGGGGGGSSSVGGHGTLSSVEFPDPSGQSTLFPPENASLVQQIVLRFSASPNPAEVGPATLPVRDSIGLIVSGRYQVAGNTVTFTPNLPTRPVDLTANPVDLGGVSLAPASTYLITVGAASWDFISGIDAGLLGSFPDPNDPIGVLLAFTTTSSADQYFTGLVPSSPALVSVTPRDGTTSVSPNLLSDPDGLFPPAEKYRLTFSQALNPELTNVSSDLFRLIDLDDSSIEFPAGLPLGAAVEIVLNLTDRAIVEVSPSGILPFGHLLALEYPQGLQGLSEGTQAGLESSIAAIFTVAEIPPTHSGPILDRIVEDFDDDSARTDRKDLPIGTVPALWDLFDSNILQAAPGFEGSPVLGRFIPAAPPEGQTKSLVLDTSTQVFPLFDGSTPDAPAGLTVNGGQFFFTDVDIPAGIVVLTEGPNPLVIVASGTVRIAGEIRVDGVAGTADGSFDSAITSTPGGSGGSGGGRGGIGHPIVYFPPNVFSPLSIIDPKAGGSGFGPGNIANAGGTGGEVGILDGPPYYTDQEMELSCLEYIDGEHQNGGKVPGGGGGSLLQEGTNGFAGTGNVLPNGKGGYNRPTKDTPTVLHGGTFGIAPFGDADASNDYIGVTGELSFVIGGQGGGGGGSRMESYFCGSWCKVDADPSNDNLCLGGEFPVNGVQTFSAAVGDAKGGGGGGGGGAIQVRALGQLTIEPTCKLTARGGAGGGGETLGCSNWGGSGGGGSGGAIVLESATGIRVKTGSLIDVSGGLGARAARIDERLTGCNPANGNQGQGGDGGHGIIQLQVPFGSIAVVEDKFTSLVPNTAWVDQSNNRNPSAFTPLSIAQSRWYDLGRMTVRDQMGPSPAFRFRIGGAETDLGGDGLVAVDGSGNVIHAASTDIVCDFLGILDPATGEYADGLEPRGDFIPLNASIKVEFQGADAIVSGSKEVDPSTITEWESSPRIADAHQFIRYRVTFDVTADGSSLRPGVPLPAVQSMRIDAEYGGR